MAVSEKSEIANLNRARPKMVVRDRTISVDGRSIMDFAENLDSYIDQNYETLETINNYEFMKLKIR